MLQGADYLACLCFIVADKCLSGGVCGGSIFELLGLGAYFELIVLFNGLYMEKDYKTTRPERKRSFGGRPGGFERRGKPGQSLSEEIMELDGQLLAMLTRRSTLMAKLRKGKAHAATPGIIKSEKQIRSAWEQQSGKLSHSPRLSRQLFSLISELELHPEKEGVEHTPFNLNPRRQAVDVDVQGPSSIVLTQLWLALAASSACSAKLLGVLRAEPVLNMVRAFEQSGVSVAVDGDNLVLDGNKLPDYHGKGLFLGDDLFTFYMLAFLGISQPGKLRFTGGPLLKEADLSALGRFLPQLGVRLASVVPGSKGLPVNLECAGDLPKEMTIPADLPYLAGLAFVLAAMTWRHQVKINLSELDSTRKAKYLDILKQVFAVLPAAGKISEDSIDYSGAALSELDFPQEIKLPLDAALSASYLALPIFAGGKVKLSGKFAEQNYISEINELMGAFGLIIKVEGEATTSELASGYTWPNALEVKQLSEELHPLFWALNARLAQRAKETIQLRAYPKNANLELAADFLAQAGLSFERTDEAVLISPLEAEEFQAMASKTYGWPCPSCYWGVALSLVAFMRNNIKLANPDCVSQYLPDYWHFYNRLPNPSLQVTEDEAAVSSLPVRRRIKTDVVVEPELREDFEDD